MKIRTTGGTRRHDRCCGVATGRGVSAVAAQAALFYPWPGLAFVPIRDAPICRWALVWRTAAESPLIRAFSQALADTGDLARHDVCAHRIADNRGAIGPHRICRPRIRLLRGVVDGSDALVQGEPRTSATCRRARVAASCHRVMSPVRFGVHSPSSWSVVGGVGCIWFSKSVEHRHDEVDHVARSEVLFAVDPHGEPFVGGSDHADRQQQLVLC